MARATIKDVAAAAGVSISAVSYILNGSTKKKYSEATVKAVRRAAEKLNYSPNNLARGMRSQKANAIGIVNFWENSGAVFAPTLRAVAEAAGRYIDENWETIVADLGALISVESVEDREAAAENAPAALHLRLPDGNFRAAAADAAE